MKKLALLWILTTIFSIAVVFAGGNTEEWMCPACSKSTYITMPTIKYTDDHKIPLLEVTFHMKMLCNFHEHYETVHFEDIVCSISLPDVAEGFVSLARLHSASSAWQNRLNDQVSQELLAHATAALEPPIIRLYEEDGRQYPYHSSTEEQRMEYNKRYIEYEKRQQVVLEEFKNEYGPIYGLIVAQYSSPVTDMDGGLDYDDKVHFKVPLTTFLEKGRIYNMDVNIVAKSSSGQTYSLTLRQHLSLPPD
ncbi:MAG: hypothetical protein SO369_06745 [Treponema sp.]|nr:hypothetical protein [Treponema sp.]